MRMLVSVCVCVCAYVCFVHVSVLVVCMCACVHACVRACILRACKPVYMFIWDSVLNTSVCVVLIAPGL